MTDWPLCRVLLMKNARFPWLILVPRRDGLRELHDLSDTDFAHATQEVRKASGVLQQMTGADKMNVAALGNMVPQLHIHVIARFTTDAAWPNPVWNSGVAAEAYGEDALAHRLEKLRAALG